MLELSGKAPVLVFKHSSICAVSAFVKMRIRSLTDESDPPVFEVVVQEARPLSNEIADRYGIRHETPQAILFYRNRPVFHASHGAISAEAVRTAARRAVTES